MSIQFKIIDLFKTYLKEKNEETNTQTYDVNSPTSIFKYKDEFEEFVSVELDDDFLEQIQEGFSLDNLKSLEVDENGKFLPSDNTNSQAAVFSDIINNLITDSDFLAAFDTNLDGKLSNEEYQSMLNKINTDDDTSSISFDEFFSALDNVPEFAQDVKTQYELQQYLQSVRENNASALNQPVFSSLTSSGSKGSKGSSSVSNKKTIDNMTRQELSTELEKTNGNLTQSKDEISAIYSGESPELKQLSEEIKSAYSTYLEEIKEADSELAQQINDKQNEIDQQNQAINQTNVEILNQEELISQTQFAYDSAVSQVNTLSSSISTLEGELSSLKTGTTDAEKKKYSKKKADINSKLADARAQLSKAQADMEKYKTQLDEANEKLQTLQANLKTQQDTLSLLEADMAELQEKVTSLISAQNGNGSGEFSGLAKSFENYNNLLTEFDTTKAELLSAAQTDYDELSTYQNELRDKLIEKEAIATSSKFRVTGFETEYNFEGANFDVVGINGFDSLDEFTRYVINSGLTNTGQYGTMQCFNYSIQMGKLALGVAEDVVTEAFLQETQNPDFGDIDLAGKLSRQHEYNQRCFMQTKSSDRSAEMSIMANELQSGRPCVVSVPYEGGSHYVLAVGIRQGASEPYQQSDFLCVDSYSGKILTLGERRKLATGNGIFVYSEGYHYKNGDGVYIPDYFSWVRNQYA